MPEISLPLKTRIATWWIAVVTLIAVVVAIVIVTREYQNTHHEKLGLELAMYIFLILGDSILYILPGILVELRKKWPWIVATTLLFVEIIVVTITLFMNFDYLGSLLLLAYLVPFVLIFFDRRNYWKMLCYQSNAKHVLSGEEGEVMP